MIDSLINVSKNMVRQFAGPVYNAPMNFVDARGDAFDVSVVFFKKSSYDFTETNKEKYPLITIQEYFPQFLDEWHNDPENVVKRYSDYKDLDNDGTFDTVSWIKDPLFMSFRFDISTACKSYYQDKALGLYFLQRFGNKGTFEFNIEPVSGIADYVDYTVTSNEVERTDGVFETNYEFTLKCWVYITDVVEYRQLLIQQVNLISNLQTVNSAMSHSHTTDTRTCKVSVLSPSDFEEAVNSLITQRLGEGSDIIDFTESLRNEIITVPLNGTLLQEITHGKERKVFVQFRNSEGRVFNQDYTDTGTKLTIRSNVPLEGTVLIL